MSSSGVRSRSAEGLAPGDLLDEVVDDTGVRDNVDDISRRETDDETAELAGVLKFFDARRTFQN